MAPSADGTPISFEAAGSGDRALVFVHGWSCDRTYWRHQVAEFSSTYLVVTIDLAGHGTSGASRAAWTMPAFGADVVAVANALELRDMVLIGHSMGGDVIVEAALSLGDRVAGLVWVDTYRRLTESETPLDIEAFSRPFREDFVAATRSLISGMFPSTADAALVEAIVGAMSAAPPEIALDALRHAAVNDGPVMAALPTLNVPVFAINPDHGPTDEASLRRHGVETVIVSGAGHFPMLEDPPQFNRLLGDVLARMPRPNGRRTDR